MRWAYGITTTPHRRETYLPATMKSLEAAGFGRSVLFVDGATSDDYAGIDNPTVARQYPMGNFGNWHAAAIQIYHYDPMADFYAIFEDDLLISRNAKQYLERTVDHLDGKKYYNLFANKINAARTTHGYEGWFQSDLNGGGAVALVFPNAAFRTILSSRRLIDHPWTSQHPRERIDGEISAIARENSIIEHCHAPSIVQHVGDVSLLNHSYPPSPTFRGEEFDLLLL